MANPKMTKLSHSIHIMLTGKGGVGKSTATSMLLEHMQNRFGELAKGYDTDTENKTLTQYRQLPVEEIDVLDDLGTDIDKSKFDNMISAVIEVPGVHVIDNGANTFRPMIAYLINEGTPQIAQEYGTPIYVHCVIAGGQIKDTVASFEMMAQAFQDTAIKFVLWINENAGDAILDDVPVLDHPKLRGYAHQIAGIVVIPKGDELARTKVRALIESRQTYNSYMTDPANNLAARCRIKRALGSVFEQLDAVDW